MTEEFEQNLANPAPHNVGKNLRPTIFYNDANAEIALAKIDQCAGDLFDALKDPQHSMWQLGGKNIVELLNRFVSHYEFRARLDLAKEQYYNPNPVAGTTNIQINNNSGFAEKIIEYDV